MQLRREADHSRARDDRRPRISTLPEQAGYPRRPMGDLEHIARTPRAGHRPSGYIASRSIDWLLIIGAPVLALALVEAFNHVSWLDTSYEVLGVEQLAAPLLIIVVTHAHLFAVFFRSSGDTRWRSWSCPPCSSPGS